MEINVSNPASYFSFFYVLSFGVTFMLFIFFSYRMKIPVRSVLLLLTTVSLCTIIGSRLSTIPFSEWGQIIVSGRYAEYQSRYAIGGLLFGLGGLVLAQYFLRTEKSIINLYAWIAPIGLGIQKIGCFFNGCCYGIESNLPWSVQYPGGTSAHYHQLVNGLIETNSPFSLHVHPVQLYETLLFFLISFIVWKSQKFWKKTWNALMFSLLLFFVFRFFIEFVRDPSSSNFEVRYILGISLVQWFLLALGIVCFIFLLISESRPVSVSADLPENNKIPVNPVLYILSVSVVVYIFRGLFTPFELFSLNLKFLPAVIITATDVLRSLKIVRVKLATASFFVVPVFLTTQTFLPDSVKSHSGKDFYNEVKSYNRIDFSTSFGNYYNTLNYNPRRGECGTTYTKEDYDFLYWMAGGGYSNIKKEEKSVSTRGINIFGGILDENNITKQWEKKYVLYGVNPYIKYDFEWFGLGIGASIGNIRWVPAAPIDRVSVDRGSRFSPILPEFVIRFGKSRIIDAQYSYGFNLPTALPVPLQELSIGTGFGYKTGYNLRVGTAVAEDYKTYFVSGEALIRKDLGLSFKYISGNGDYSFSTIDNFSVARRGRLLFGVNYRFGFKK